MAPAPITYADIIRKEAEWKRDPYPTDNVISDLFEMEDIDRTLFTGADGQLALRNLVVARAYNKSPVLAVKRKTLVYVQNVFDKLKEELDAKNPDEARIRRMYAVPPPIVAPAPAPAPVPAPVPAPAPAPAFGIMAPIQAAPAPPAANLFGFLAPGPGRGGRRRRTRRGRKSRRKSLRQRK